MKLAALAAATLSALALATGTAAADPLPTFDFSDCPALPSGANPAEWRCETFISQGTLSFGKVNGLSLGEIRMTFAEGKLDGKFAQVFSTLKHAPAPVPQLPGTTIQLHYGGYSDFESTEERKGELNLYATLRGPLVPGGATVDSLKKPIHSVVQQVGKTEVLSTNPLVVKFSVIDEAMALPAARGPFPWLANHALGLPSTAVFEETSYVGFKPYA
ncbi:hypothetical protein [Amycolatopsis sp. NPDC059657]|uniref:hypothetical protein n=1 Tax=Amycolatopsis sp. NPDC059657 TaxID=3346899 RepID=UPI00366B9F7E